MINDWIGLNFSFWWTSFSFYRYFVAVLQALFPLISRFSNFISSWFVYAKILNFRGPVHHPLLKMLGFYLSFFALSSLKLFPQRTNVHFLIYVHFFFFDASQFDVHALLQKLRRLTFSKHIVPHASKLYCYFCFNFSYFYQNFCMFLRSLSVFKRKKRYFLKFDNITNFNLSETNFTSRNISVA